MEAGVKLARRAADHRAGATTEALLYLYLFGPARGRAARLRELRAQLDAGNASSDWLFDPIVDLAVRCGHPESDCLAALARVVNSEDDPTSLSDWPAWQAAARTGKTRRRRRRTTGR